MKRPFALVPLLLLAAAAPAPAAEATFDAATSRRLATLRIDEALDVAAFPVGAAGSAPIHFKRVRVYADGATIDVIENGKVTHLPLSDRIFLRGYSSDGSVRVALAFEADGTLAQGSQTSDAGTFAVRGQYDKTGALRFATLSEESTRPPGSHVDYSCGNENIDLQDHSSSLNLKAQLDRTMRAPVAQPDAVAAGPFRTAMVALDTDSKFMAVFSNNTSDARNWIATLFNTMNTMYENDLNVQLVIGKTILRVGAAGDPYTSLGSGFSTVGEMDIFANYWKTNESRVPRAFTALLSGAIPASGGSCQASGVAWIDEYCDGGHANGADTAGSYSLDKICSSKTIDAGTQIASRILGHELGHNFGADHTHCTDKTTGAARTGTNTIDTCYNGEAPIGCYGGAATTCPGSAGTIMSYCHLGACPNDNLLQFHATQINKTLLPQITANTPVCINNFIFFNDFD
ncbi:MAG TPA: M12 family metallo-peptidase [Rudaea sp.]